MAGPITWKNIDVVAPQREAYNPMIAAQLGMTAGFDKLGQVYDQYQNQRKADNTSAFEMALAQYKTPEEMRAAIASGAIDNLRAQYGIQMDQKVANTGADTRLTNLMTQTKAGQEFDDNQKDRLDDPIVQEIKARVARGDIVGARALQEQSQLRKPGDVAQSITVGDQALQKFADERRAAQDTSAASRVSTAGGVIRNQEAQLGLDVKTALQPELLAAATEKARSSEAYRNAEKVMMQGAQEVNAALEKGDITRDEATKRLHARRQQAMQLGINGEQLALLDKTYAPMYDFSQYSPAEQRQMDRVQQAAANDVQFEYNNNATLRYMMDPRSAVHAQEVRDFVAGAFKPAANETPAQAQKRERLQADSTAEMERLIGKQYKRIINGKEVTITATPEDIKQVFNQYQAQNPDLFTEGSTRNMDPTKWVKFWEKNVLENLLTDPRRVAKEQRAQEIYNNNSRVARQNLLDAQKNSKQ